MYEFARRSERDRRDVFRETAGQMAISEAIIEKDFWVCWILKYLFEKSPWSESLMFKGGTSLSKAYSAIKRFSEDIDLILDWRLLGYTEEDLSQTRSRTQQDKFNSKANGRCADFLKDTFITTLLKDIRHLTATDDFTIKVDDFNPQSVLIRYPKSFSLTAIRPEIILEIGPLAEWFPNYQRTITSYTAELHPELFEESDSLIPTIAVERTFWEKATILHQEANRPPEKSLPARFSRHYYDLYMLNQAEYGDKAMTDLELLRKVVAYKDKYYHCAWAEYNNAKPGTFKLRPPTHNMEELKKDYRSMRTMIFGDTPEFDEIIKGLSELEERINRIPQIS